MDFTRLGLLIQAVIVLCYAVPGSGILWDWKKIVTLFLMILCGSILFFSLFLLKATFTFFYNSESQFYEYIHLWGA